MDQVAMKSMNDELIVSEDKLRELEKVAVPDIRNSFFSRMDALGTHPDTLVEHHEDIAKIQLSSKVSTDVVVQFETARNLYLYSWYVYRFYPVAQHQALASLELGLRDVLGPTIPKSYLRRPNDLPTLRPLLRFAIDSGVIKNEGFRAWHEHVQRRAEIRTGEEQIAAMIAGGDDLCEFRYADVVANDQDRNYDFLSRILDFLPNLRNSHAHGSTNLSNSVLGTIELVQEILNQIYESMAPKSSSET